MAFPADRFTPRPADQRLPLRLPARLSAAVAQLPPEPAPDTTTATPEAEPDLPAALVVSSNGVDPVDHTIERTSPLRRSRCNRVNLGTRVGGKRSAGPTRASDPCVRA